VEVEFAR
jgi:transposase